MNPEKAHALDDFAARVRAVQAQNWKGGSVSLEIQEGAIRIVATTRPTSQQVETNHPEAGMKEWSGSLVITDTMFAAQCLGGWEAIRIGYRELLVLLLLARRMLLSDATLWLTQEDELLTLAVTWGLGCQTTGVLEFSQPASLIAKANTSALSGLVEALEGRIRVMQPHTVKMADLIQRNTGPETH